MFNVPREESFVCRCLKKGVSCRGNPYLAWRKDVASFLALCTAEPIFEAERVTGILVIFGDMTEADFLSSKLSNLARQDPLTGPVNRRGFENCLEVVLESTEHNHPKHALCYFDQDQFTMTNDTWGHLAGDQLLRQIAGVLTQSVRKRPRPTFPPLLGELSHSCLNECVTLRTERVG